MLCGRRGRSGSSGWSCRIGGAETLQKLLDLRMAMTLGITERSAAPTVSAMDVCLTINHEFDKLQVTL